MTRPMPTTIDIGAPEAPLDRKHQTTLPMKHPIYLDYNATTPVAPEVADAIEPFLRTHFGNPSSSHVYGRHTRPSSALARSLRR